jgi:hypothetical protein
MLPRSPENPEYPNRYKVGTDWPPSRQSARLSLRSSELAPPAPSPGSECCPPLFQGGGAHSLVGKGAGEPVRTNGHTLWYSKYNIILYETIWLTEKRI